MNPANSTSQQRFYSLSIRILIPLAAVALMVAGIIGAISYWLGDRATQRALDERTAAIETTLQRVTFPLSRPVLEMLSELSGAEFITYGRDDRQIETTLPVNVASQSDAFLRRTMILSRRESSDGVQRVDVLYDAPELQRTKWRFASLPLLTGLSTIALMSILAWFLSQHVIRRIGQLHGRMDRIATGEFEEFEFEPAPRDELGQLDEAMQKMGRDLARLWKTVQRQERERLIHLFAAGLAHQLRNSLTGARMAVELHAEHCHDNQDEGVKIALHELVRTEEYVQRILMVASEQDETLQPGALKEIIEEVQGGLLLMAKHQHVELIVEVDETVASCWVADRQGCAAALQNLVLNGLQAGGDRVRVIGERIDRSLNGTFVWLSVSDNGRGPPILAEGDIFDPFVTTKPEGMGIGLTLVRQAVTRLGGEVDWKRENDETVFTMRLPWHDRAPQLPDEHSASA